MQRRILFATVVTALLLAMLTIGGQYIHPATARQTTATSSSITAAQARPTTSPLPTVVVESGFMPPPNEPLLHNSHYGHAPFNPERD